MYFAVGVQGASLPASTGAEHRAVFENCTKTVDDGSVYPGWDGCTGSGWTRIRAVFVGIGVFHTVRPTRVHPRPPVCAFVSVRRAVKRQERVGKGGSCCGALPALATRQDWPALLLCCAAHVCPSFPLRTRCLRISSHQRSSFLIRLHPFAPHPPRLSTPVLRRCPPPASATINPRRQTSPGGSPLGSSETTAQWIRSGRRPF